MRVEGSVSRKEGGEMIGFVLSLLITPSACFEPCEIKATITISGYQEGKPVCISVYDTDTMPTRRSCWPWAGQRVTEVRVRNIPIGQYRVVASIPDGNNTSKLLVVH